VRIREITEDDYSPLSYLHWLSLIEEHKEIGIETNVNYLHLRLQWNTEKPKGYLAECDSGIVGFISENMVYVSSYFMRMGIGTKLVQKLKPSEFWVAESNKRAQAFYTANGYNPTSETRMVDKLGYDIIERKWTTIPDNACDV